MDNNINNNQIIDNNNNNNNNIIIIDDQINNNNDMFQAPWNNVEMATQNSNVQSETSSVRSDNNNNNIINNINNIPINNNSNTVYAFNNDLAYIGKPNMPGQIIQNDQVIAQVPPVIDNVAAGQMLLQNNLNIDNASANTKAQDNVNTKPVDTNNIIYKFDQDNVNKNNKTISITLNENDNNNQPNKNNINNNLNINKTLPNIDNMTNNNNNINNVQFNKPLDYSKLTNSTNVNNNNSNKQQNIMVNSANLPPMNYHYVDDNNKTIIKKNDIINQPTNNLGLPQNKIYFKDPNSIYNQNKNMISDYLNDKINNDNDKIIKPNDDKYTINYDNQNNDIVKDEQINDNQGMIDTSKKFTIVNDTLLLNDSKFSENWKDVYIRNHGMKKVYDKDATYEGIVTIKINKYFTYNEYPNISSYSKILNDAYNEIIDKSHIAIKYKIYEVGYKYLLLSNKINKINYYNTNNNQNEKYKIKIDTIKNEKLTSLTFSDAIEITNNDFKYKIFNIDLNLFGVFKKIEVKNEIIDLYKKALETDIKKKILLEDKEGGIDSRPIKIISLLDTSAVNVECTGYLVNLLILIFNYKIQNEHRIHNNYINIRKTDIFTEKYIEDDKRTMDLLLNRNNNETVMRWHITDNDNIINSIHLYCCGVSTNNNDLINNQIVYNNYIGTKQYNIGNTEVIFDLSDIMKFISILGTKQICKENINSARKIFNMIIKNEITNIPKCGSGWLLYDLYFKPNNNSDEISKITNMKPIRYIGLNVITNDLYFDIIKLYFLYIMASNPYLNEGYTYDGDNRLFIHINYLLQHIGGDILITNIYIFYQGIFSIYKIKQCIKYLDENEKNWKLTISLNYYINKKTEFMTKTIWFLSILGYDNITQLLNTFFKKTIKIVKGMFLVNKTNSELMFIGDNNKMVKKINIYNNNMYACINNIAKFFKAVKIYNYFNQPHFYTYNYEWWNKTEIYLYPGGGKVINFYNKLTQDASLDFNNNLKILIHQDEISADFSFANIKNDDIYTTVSIYNLLKQYADEITRYNKEKNKNINDEYMDFKAKLDDNKSIFKNDNYNNDLNNNKMNNTNNNLNIKNINNNQSEINNNQNNTPKIINSNNIPIDINKKIIESDNNIINDKVNNDSNNNNNDVNYKINDNDLDNNKMKTITDTKGNVIRYKVIKDKKIKLDSTQIIDMLNNETHNNDVAIRDYKNIVEQYKKINVVQEFYFLVNKNKEVLFDNNVINIGGIDYVTCCGNNIDIQMITECGNISHILHKTLAIQQSGMIYNKHKEGVMTQSMLEYIDSIKVGSKTVIDDKLKLKCDKISTADNSEFDNMPDALLVSYFNNNKLFNSIHIKGLKRVYQVNKYKYEIISFEIAYYLSLLYRIYFIVNSKNEIYDNKMAYVSKFDNNWDNMITDIYKYDNSYQNERYSKLTIEKLVVYIYSKYVNIHKKFYGNTQISDNDNDTDSIEEDGPNMNNITKDTKDKLNNESDDNNKNNNNNNNNTTNNDKLESFNIIQIDEIDLTKEAKKEKTINKTNTISNCFTFGNYSIDVINEYNRYFNKKEVNKLSLTEFNFIAISDRVNMLWFDNKTFNDYENKIYNTYFVINRETNQQCITYYEVYKSNQRVIDDYNTYDNIYHDYDSSNIINKYLDYTETKRYPMQIRWRWDSPYVMAQNFDNCLFAKFNYRALVNIMLYDHDGIFTYHGIPLYFNVIQQGIINMLTVLYYRSQYVLEILNSRDILDYRGINASGYNNLCFWDCVNKLEQLTKYKVDASFGGKPHISNKVYLPQRLRDIFYRANKKICDNCGYNLDEKNDEQMPFILVPLALWFYNLSPVNIGYVNRDNLLISFNSTLNDISNLIDNNKMGNLYKIRRTIIEYHKKMIILKDNHYYLFDIETNDVMINEFVTRNGWKDCNLLNVLKLANNYKNIKNVYSELIINDLMGCGILEVYDKNNKNNNHINYTIHQIYQQYPFKLYDNLKGGHENIKIGEVPIDIFIKKLKVDKNVIKFTKNINEERLIIIYNRYINHKNIQWLKEQIINQDYITSYILTNVIIYLIVNTVTDENIQLMYYLLQKLLLGNYDEVKEIVTNIRVNYLIKNEQDASQIIYMHCLVGKYGKQPDWDEELKHRIFKTINNKPRGISSEMLDKINNDNNQQNYWHNFFQKYLPIYKIKTIKWNDRSLLGTTGSAGNLGSNDKKQIKEITNKNYNITKGLSYLTIDNISELFENQSKIYNIYPIAKYNDLCKTRALYPISASLTFFESIGAVVLEDNLEHPSINFNDKNEYTIKRDKIIMESCIKQKWISSYDYEDFNSQHELNIITNIFKAYYSYIYNNRKDIDDWQSICQSIYITIESISHWKIIYKNNEYDWKGGLPSGWRYTSIINSLINIMISDSALTLMNVACEWRYIQGDDFIGCFNSYEEIVLYEDILNKCGCRSNVSKNIKQQGYCEFLKTIYYPTGSINKSLIRGVSIFVSGNWESNHKLYDVNEMIDWIIEWLTTFSNRYARFNESFDIICYVFLDLYLTNITKYKKQIYNEQIINKWLSFKYKKTILKYSNVIKSMYKGLFVVKSKDIYKDIFKSLVNSITSGEFVLSNINYDNNTLLRFINMNNKRDTQYEMGQQQYNKSIKENIINIYSRCERTYGGRKIIEMSKENKKMIEIKLSSKI